MTNRRQPISYTPDSASHSHDSQVQHILVVEDEEMLRIVLGDALEMAGFKVTCYTDSPQALEHFKTSWQTIDLVVLDLLLPSMNGEKLLYHMQELNPDVKAIFTSGYFTEGDIPDELKDFLASEHIDIINKPFKPSEFIRKVKATILSATQ